MSETTLLQEIRLACSRGTVRLWRNNCGRLQDKTGRWVSFGVASPGGSDLIGYRSLIITPEMVGQKIAQFVAIECKAAKGTVTDDQQHFIDTARSAGAVGCAVYSVEEAMAALR